MRSLLERQAFIAGLKAGIEAHAIWKDGVQLVGAMQRPLNEALSQIENTDSYYDELVQVWEAQSEEQNT